MQIFEYYYELGRLSFEMRDYDNAVAFLIKSYDLSESVREKVVADLYNCFIIPNKEEFEENIRKSKKNNVICSLDFIPVSDSKFYMYDSENKVFGKAFDIEDIYSDKKESDYRALFIGKNDDVSRVLEALSSKQWNEIYMIDDETDSKINSFYKLPGWIEYIENNITIFRNEKEIESYFINNCEKCLPNIIVSDVAKYKDIFERVHQTRLIKKKECPPILSICIPTYNRGERALKCVQSILESELDNEIEVVVSNNGSFIGVDEYKKIERIKDNRIKYYCFESNQGLFGNIVNCLRMAKGEFAIMVSDEDYIINGSLSTYINFLKTNRNIAAFNYGAVNERVEKGSNAVNWGATNNYISGITFNMECVKKSDCLSVVMNNRDNYFCQLYVHCAILIVLGNRYDMCKTNIPIILKGEESNFSDFCSKDNNESKLSEYIMYENRIKLLDAFSEFIDNNIFGKEMQYEMMVGYIEMIYGMLNMAKQTYPDEFNFFNICCSLFCHINERVNGKYAAYATLDRVGMHQSLAAFFVKCCSQAIDYNKVSCFVEKITEQVNTYEKKSGYDYFGGVYNIFGL